MSDPVRARLLANLDRAERNIDATTQRILRALVGGLEWTSSQLLRDRQQLAHDLADLEIVTRLLDALDKLDAGDLRPEGSR